MKLGIFLALDGLTGSSIAFDHGAGNDSWSYDAELGAVSATALQVAQALTTWILDGARPWVADIDTATLSVTVPGLARHGVEIVTTGSDPDWGNVTVSAALQALLGWPADPGGSDTLDGDGIVSSCAADFDLATLYPWAQGGRGVAGAGAWQMDPQKGALKRPGLSGLLTEQEATTLDAALAVAANPRVADVYQRHTQSWQRVHLSRLRTRRNDDVQRHAYTFETLA